jgi:hypothetical protein
MRTSALLFAGVCVSLFILLSPEPSVSQQTLYSKSCVEATNIPRHYSFTQSGVPYWAVVGVAPQTGDDKDMYVYTGPNATGTLLASSIGVDGSDFVVADFNHTPLTTYYPSVSYGSTTAPYTVEWNQGGYVFAVNEEVKLELSQSGTACAMFQVWDVKLEAGAAYRLLITYASAPVRLVLFRNPGTGAYWAGRASAALEISGTASDADYVAPATDWYGLVLSPVYRSATPILVTIELRKLDACRPLAAGVCESPVAYTPDTGPDDSFYFQQTVPFWSAVAIAPPAGQSIIAQLRSQCDYDAAGYAPIASVGAFNETVLIVGDFNHVTLPSANYVTFDIDDPSAPATIEWEDGDDYFYMNSGVSVTVGGTEGDCNLVKIWDAYLTGTFPYRLGFSETGTADIHLALFGHNDTAPYFAGLDQAIYLQTDPGLHGFVPGYMDYYGLALFANRRDAAGSYYVSLERLDDCDLIESNTCWPTGGNLKDFRIGAPDNNYWIAVGVLPVDGDDKDISVYSSCDGGEPLLGYSNGTQGMDFVVADCNHLPVAALSDGLEAPAEPLANNWYPRVTYGTPWSDYTVSSDLGNSISEDLFPHDTVVQGTVGGVSDECGILKIWDVYLQSGLTYTFGFTRAGSADVRAALFRNTTNNRIWLGRTGRVWELAESQNFDYTAPATDYYGLVVFANRREKLGSYTLRVSRASGVTGIDPEPLAPSRYALYQNAPNPFNPTTEIRYDVPSSGGHVQLRVYDVHGRLVRTLVDSIVEGGSKSVTWDSRDDRGSLVATGVYFYRFDAPGFSETRKLTVMK